LDSIIAGADDSESSRQLVDYLRKQLDTIDPEKRETPAQTKARKKKKAADDLAEKEGTKEDGTIDFMG
jgi:hypothetical protein